MVRIHKLPVKRLTFRRRQALGLICLKRIRIRKIDRRIIQIQRLIVHEYEEENIDEELIDDLLDVWTLYRQQRMEYSIANVDLESLALKPISRKHLVINELENEDIPGNFRFRSKEQLYDLVECFRFPEYFYTSIGDRFHRE
jgi:hypothetical protein